MDAHKNFARSTVATAPSPATSGTSLDVAAGEGALFPTPPFNATVWPAGAQPTTVNAEIVRVTGVSTDTFTIARAQETGAGGPSARTIVVGDQIAATVTAKTLTDIEARTSNIDNSQIAAAAGIEYSKLALTGSIVNADIVDLAWSKLTGTPTTLAGYGITDAVTAISIASANGFAGSSSGGATPALTLTTTITGVLKGNGTAISAAVAGDFPTLNQNTTGSAASLSATLVVTSGGTGTATQFTAGSVVFAGASGVYGQDNANLFWDDGNNRLGIGTATPNATLEVRGASPSLLISDNSAGNAANLDFRAFNRSTTSARIQGAEGGGANSGRIVVLTKTSSGALTNALTITEDGNVGIKQTPSYRLDLSSGLGGTDTYLQAFRVGYALIGGHSGNDADFMGYNFKPTASAGSYVYDIGDVASMIHFALGFRFMTAPSGSAGGAITATERMRITNTGLVGVGLTPTAVLHLKAGTATANTAPLKFNSGTLLTTAEAGAVEFLTDDFFATITTGAARKGLVLDDGARLTSGKIPVATTNGRLVNLTASSAYTITNVTTDRAYDANATALDEIADVMGTLIADLQGKGILG